MRKLTFWIEVLLTVMKVITVALGTGCTIYVEAVIVFTEIASLYRYNTNTVFNKLVWMVIYMYLTASFAFYEIDFTVDAVVFATKVFNWIRDMNAIAISLSFLLIVIEIFKAKALAMFVVTTSFIGFTTIVNLTANFNLKRVKLSRFCWSLFRGDSGKIHWTNRYLQIQYAEKTPPLRSFFISRQSF